VFQLIMVELFCTQYVTINDEIAHELGENIS
jgi:hypothetical protein